jgi:hypothetical protein
MTRTALALALATTAYGCGYRAVHGGAPRSPDERCEVALARSGVPDAVVADEVLVGVREELARHGALGGAARCRVEVLRVDEASEGIGVVSSGPTGAPGATLVPSSRATRVGVLARADWALGESVTRDTADVRVFETVAVASDARAAAFQHTDALRAAARRVGQRLGRRLLGLPAPSDE